ncbi:transmembrane and immunoglobulin domain-containing protein 1 [Limosa lapponica baueri]|nr:transmembrane and immunoglobulin domain-containing protein 1 [Limosa lapponica baueri]
MPFMALRSQFLTRDVPFVCGDTDGGENKFRRLRGSHPLQPRHRLPVELTGEESLHIEEEKDVTMSCNAKSNPQAQTAWYKNNDLLTLEQDRYQLYQTSEVVQLSITKVQKSDNGTYTCVVTSSLGEGRKDFHLIVEDKKPLFPKEAVIAAVVVVTVTVLFGIVARKDKIFKWCFPLLDNFYALPSA